MDKKKITTIIFDLDGTLLNSLQDLMNSTNYALRKYNCPERTMQEIRQFVGNGVRKLMERSVPEKTTPERFEAIFDVFKTNYMQHSSDNTCPYDGIIDLLAELNRRGYKMAIVSNKFYDAVQELNETFFSEYIKIAIGEYDGINKKPAPDTVYEALRRLNSKKEESIYVGDSDVDVATARNSGLPCVSVLWGFREKQFLIQHGATTFIERPDELLELC